ncbi:ABC transporter, putative [Hondaea fermentalgiana]|uniref:ABC transporter, putative n=1 Tax=Hondaea fermentalgiana TaxID=2315210 RepID=A0A2R5GVL1_9STRA|nr:ABC transporter, putative [Hondaea fermentalgiana]|eukprot:GBG32693.1 ABC transporter, putative [Hondaea fermentalgiana]
MSEAAKSKFERKDQDDPEEARGSLYCEEESDGDEAGQTLQTMKFKEDTKRTVKLIYASIAVYCVAMVINKWLFAVAVRKMFVFLEESFTGASVLFNTPISPFWEAVFLTNMSFFEVMGVCMLTTTTIAFAGSAAQALPVRVAGALARDRRKLVLRASLRSMLQAESGSTASLLLEHIAVLYEFEAYTKFMRVSAKYSLLLVVVASLIVFWQGTLVMILTTGYLVAALTVQRKIVGPYERRRSDLQAVVSTSILDTLRSADIVKMHSMQKDEEAKLEKQEKLVGKEEKAIFARMLVLGFPTLLGMTLGLPLVIILVWQIMQGVTRNQEAVDIVFGMLAMLFLCEEGHKSFNRIVMTDSQAAKYVRVHRDIEDALVASKAHPDYVHCSDGSAKIDVGPGGVTFENVSVTYPDMDAPALHDVTFEIQQGSKMAIVAESGGGKSTLFRAVSGLVHFDGAISYGGVKLQAGAWDIVRPYMGFVSQDSRLFARSVRENIWYGNAVAVDDQEIWNALGKVGLESWAKALKNGLDTILATERMVSGGQAQRLQIARLLCRQGVQFVLLDECMSALDPAMRAHVTIAIRDYIRDKTALIITHSHDTISDLCDHVLQLDKLQAGAPTFMLNASAYIQQLAR